MNKKVTYEVKLRHRAVMANATDEEIAREVQKQADQFYWMSSVSCRADVVSIDALDENNKKVVYDVTLTKKKILRTDGDVDIEKAIQKEADMHYWQNVANCTTTVLEVENME